jgi:Tfp pilus assembly protein PilO
MSVSQGAPLVRRIFGEHRRVLLPLLIALAANVVLYAAAVYPLSQRVANIEERNRAAEQQLAAARREHGQALGTMTGKDRAGKELETFYTRVLPANVTEARRLTYLRLAQLAGQTGLRLERQTVKEMADRRVETLRALQIDMELTGSYPAMRAFIYQLETAPEFVVIDNVQLSEGADGNGQLRVAMQVSTYFRSPQS